MGHPDNSESRSTAPEKLTTKPERPAADELHEDIVQAIPFADIEDLDDIMTGEPGGGARFLKESLHNLRFVREVFAENFNCEQAAVPSTAGREHPIPHPR